MRTAIVELDPDGQVIRSGPRTAPDPHDRTAIAALSVACAAFAVAVWLVRPAATTAPTAAAPVDVPTSVASAVQIGADPVYAYVYDRTGRNLLHVLALPADANNVDLGLLPERLANEAAPSEWRRVITVRGVPGVASVEGVQFISWSERGILYWLSSPSLTAEQLIDVADGMR